MAKDIKEYTIKLDSPRYELAAGALKIPWSKLRHSTLIKLIEGVKDPNKGDWKRLDNWLALTQKEPTPNI
jgi:hypothetical protein